MTRVIGITGSIGMGKSTLAGWLAQMGYPVSNADAIVHDLFQRDAKLHDWLHLHIPKAMQQGEVDRHILGQYVFENPLLLHRLEKLLHPKVKAMHQQLIRQARRHQKHFVILDVPLLFETGSDRLCDFTILAQAPKWIQTRRVLARPGMTQAKLTAIRNRQWPEGMKQARADAIVNTGLTIAQSHLQLTRIIETI